MLVHKGSYELANSIYEQFMPEIVDLRRNTVLQSMVILWGSHFSSSQFDGINLEGCQAFCNFQCNLF